MGNSMTDNTFPIVEGPLTPSGTQITIKCPYCGKKHLHGAPEGDEAEHRRAPCWEPAALKKAGPRYFIKTAIGASTAAACRLWCAISSLVI